MPEMSGVEALHEGELTPRELEAQGRNKLIAQALEISEGTVKTHVQNLLDKLDATSRTEALTVAARCALLEL